MGWPATVRQAPRFRRQSASPRAAAQFAAPTRAASSPSRQRTIAKSAGKCSCRLSTSALSRSKKSGCRPIPPPMITVLGENAITTFTTPMAQGGDRAVPDSDCRRVAVSRRESDGMRVELSETSLASETGHPAARPELLEGARPQCSPGLPVDHRVTDLTQRPHAADQTAALDDACADPVEIVR